MARFLFLLCSFVTYVSASGSFRVRDPPESVCPMAGDGMVGYYDYHDDKNHLFFWLAESRNDPAKDPLVLWMSGGPGASSVAFGLFQELGPCLIKGPSEAAGNKYAWNSNANVLFVDQPVRVGYSYSENPVLALDEAIEDMYQFLRSFVTEYPSFASQDFYIVGESFGGTWVPALARAIDYKQSSSMAQVVRQTSAGNAGYINLRGIGLGNAQLSQALQWPGFFATGCVGEKPLFNTSACAIMEAGMPDCVAMLAACAGEKDVCGPVLDHCREQSVNLVFEAGLNPYDFRRPCNDLMKCYPEQDWIMEHLNSSESRASLGVSSDVPLNGLDLELNHNFIDGGALAIDSIGWVEDLLEKKYRVLVYVGNKDWFCNAEGERQMVNKIRWKHQSSFQALAEDPWLVHGQEVGRIKQFGELTFVEVYDAGHMVPADKPAEALVLINSWLNATL